MALEFLASNRSPTPLASLPPSRRVCERVHACGGGIYLLSSPDSAEHPGQVWAVGWAESDYWAQRAFTVFYGDLDVPPRQWESLPSLAFLGKLDDLSLASPTSTHRTIDGE